MGFTLALSVQVARFLNRGYAPAPDYAACLPEKEFPIQRYTRQKG